MTDHLRVAKWDDFIGQDLLKRRLDVHIRAALAQKHELDHVLLVGPPGFGKTSLATIISGRMGIDLLEYTMPLDERIMINIVRRHQGLLLLDEIHRAAPREQERLLPLLEFGYVQDKKGRKHMSANLTIVGATTEPEKVIEPLYDRFPIRPDFDEYTVAEMSKIVAGMARKIGVKLDTATAKELGAATGGTPRRARQFVLAARDLGAIGKKQVTANAVLDLCRVDPTGLTVQHMHYLIALDKTGGQAGLKTLQNMLRLNEPVVRELERLLVKQGLITYTERGRELTSAGYNKVKNLP